MATFLTTTILLTSLALFQIGLLVGLFLSDYGGVTIQAKLRTMVAVAVTAGWLTATIAGILLVDYTVSPLLHALMGAIVGYFFTEDGIDLTKNNGQ